MSTAAYRAFLARKQVRAVPAGLATVPEVNQRLFPFQRDIVTWALRRGRAAIFAGTGLGKTGMQLEWAHRVNAATGKPVLILTPLAVAQQTVAEAEKFGLQDVAYARYSDEAAARIVVTNYDRVEKFDLARFGAVVLDESSIIKSHESKTRALLIEMCAHIPYRLACTATPAPNDYVELGNHAEFLGVLTQKEMLATWFVHDGGIRANDGAAEWRLKGHAQRDFWAWVASWAVMIRRPSDLGYDDAGYILPPLNVHQITVPVDYRPSIETGTLFPMEARTLKERLAARRDSIDGRVAKAAEIVNAAPHRPWLVWCNLNAESDALTAAIRDAEQIKGSDPIAVKTDRLFGFTKAWPRVLVTKPTVAGFGMNWQHCADMVFVGLNDSFEQLYQAIRRCWRFGQTRPVNVHMIASETEGAVVANLKAKEAAAEAMAENLAVHMRDLCKREVRGGRVATVQARATQKMEIPTWLKAA
jgi:hypothetical protein